VSRAVTGNATGKQAGIDDGRSALFRNLLQALDGLAYIGIKSGSAGIKIGEDHLAHPHSRQSNRSAYFFSGTTSWNLE
jgi:hypothetical protein